MKKIYFFLIALCGIQVFSQITIVKDSSFGNNGAFAANLTSTQTILNSNVLILSDNSILYIVNGAEKDYLLKLKSNGNPDAGFAVNGKLEFEENNAINAVLQGEKIIVYFGPKPTDINTYEDSKILRYNRDGTLDQTFGNNGVLNEITESTNTQSLSVLVLADESLVVSNSNSTFPKKYTKNGQLQTSFGNNGEINYTYHFLLGQFSSGKIATCDVTALSSTVYSFFDLNSLTTNHVLNLNNTASQQYNGTALQNKSNISTRMTKSGVVYSIFEYQNYPLPDFSRLVVMKNEQLDADFNSSGFITSENYEHFLDVGFENNTFFILNQKTSKKSLIAYSAEGNPFIINSKIDFNLASGDEIEMKDNYILVNSVIPNDEGISSRVKIEKFLVTNEKLATSEKTVSNIVIENPIKDFLNISNAENADSFELYNVEGRKVLVSKNYKNMNTSNLPKGNYILKIKMKNGEFLSKKLIRN